MFYTVFSTSDNEYMQWQSDLLEFSWKNVGQQGELVRLVATDTPNNLPTQRYAKCVATSNWSVHPISGDAYSVYNKPKSLLEWLYRERPEGTVLLIDPDCVFRNAVKTRVAPGFPVSQGWVGLDLLEVSLENPFGLPSAFSFLNDHCARLDLTSDAVMIPTLIHTQDLRKICARWLQLCAIIRTHYRDSMENKIWEADMYGYLIACAEYGLKHEHQHLGICTNWDADSMPDSNIIHYCQPIHDKSDRVIFSKHDYQAWSKVDVSVPGKHYYDRELATILNNYIDQLPPPLIVITGTTKPKRRDDVMEGRVSDHLLLEIPNESKRLFLNASGKIIWELCDGNRSIDELASVLGQQFEVDIETMAEQIRQIVEQLNQIGFVECRQ